jgi:hypothetical protein
LVHDELILYLWYCIFLFEKNNGRTMLWGYFVRIWLTGNSSFYKYLFLFLLNFLRSISKTLLSFLLFKFRLNCSYFLFLLLLLYKSWVIVFFLDNRILRISLKGIYRSLYRTYCAISSICLWPYYFCPIIYLVLDEQTINILIAVLLLKFA